MSSEQVYDFGKASITLSVISIFVTVFVAFLLLMHYNNTNSKNKDNDDTVQKLSDTLTKYINSADSRINKNTSDVDVHGKQISALTTSSDILETTVFDPDHGLNYFVNTTISPIVNRMTFLPINLQLSGQVSVDTSDQASPIMYPLITAYDVGPIPPSFNGQFAVSKTSEGYLNIEFGLAYPLFIMFFGGLVISKTSPDLSSFTLSDVGFSTKGYLDRLLIPPITVNSSTPRVFSSGPAVFPFGGAGGNKNFCFGVYTPITAGTYSCLDSQFSQIYIYILCNMT